MVPIIALGECQVTPMIDWRSLTDCLFGKKRIVLLSYGSASQNGSASRGSGQSSYLTIDPIFKRTMMYLLIGTRGGYNRLKILRLIQEEPMNANKICERLQLDYKTVQHHIKILEESKIIVTSSPKGTYGAMYFLAAYVEKNISFIDDIWVKFGKR